MRLEQRASNSLAESQAIAHRPAVLTVASIQRRAELSLLMIRTCGASNGWQEAREVLDGVFMLGSHVSDGCMLARIPPLPGAQKRWLKGSPNRGMHRLGAWRVGSEAGFPATLTGVSQMFSERLPWILGNVVVIAVIAFLYHRRLNFVKGCYRRLEEYADNILQHFQGTVLNVQGILNDLSPEDRTRRRIDHALENADKRLSLIREQMQPLCSEQQQDRIQ